MLELIAINLRRRWARTLLTAMGIAVGVGTIVALLSLTAGLQQAASGLIDLGKGNIGIFQRDVADPTASALPQTLVREVAATPGVVEASPMQLVTDAVPDDASAIVFGVEPGGFVAGLDVLVSGRAPRGNEAMVGEELASRLGIGPGDRLRLGGMEIPVVGIYHSGVSFQDSGVTVPLPLAQRLSGRPGQVTTIAAKLAPEARLADVTAEIQRRIPGTTAIGDPDELDRADANTRLIDKAVIVIVVLALIIGGISVTNTMLMAVLERQRELGVLAAVGWSPRQIAMLVFGEGVGVSLLGAGLGLALGIALSELIVRALSASAFVAPEITAWGLGRGLLVGVAIGVVGGLYPAWRVSRLRPAEALTRE
jgi:putative ABC transport system permease protein